MTSSLVQKQKKFFTSGTTRDVSFRIESLKKLKAAIHAHEQEIAQALFQDLAKPPFEAFISETYLVLTEIAFALNNIQTWTNPRRVNTPLTHAPAKSCIYPEPRGVVLIMAPWNYPIHLTLIPLIGALAAGNCAIIKPSEFAPHSAQLIASLIAQIFDEQHVAVVQGDADIAQALTQESFDYIFFTGSTAIGKKVMHAAAERLIPITLELGGKSPCIVTDDADLECAAKRIVWGKFFNAGQNCVSPDYVLVHEHVKNELITSMKSWIRNFFGIDPAQSSDYARIINEQHITRLRSLLEHGTLITGGQSDIQKKYFAPTIIDVINLETPLMQEEIFGPILPIVTYATLDQALTLINNRPAPLALYVFSSSKITHEKIITQTQSGGICINDVIMHATTPDLPFGGIGMSGIGAYHGKASFDTFTHYKSVFTNSCRFDTKLRYPPYENFHSFVEKLLRWLS